MSRAGAALLGLALAAPAAWAQQTVYRCGTSYQPTPCEQGRAVDVADPRSEAQRRAAQAVAGSEARHAAALERERRQRETAQRPAAAAGIGVPASASTASAPAKPHRKAPRAKAGQQKDFVALEPRRPARP